ncbi:hypothetical protein JZU46_07345 [bacterium]|jgi:hypothetical protein|nr:hypothetical protein [bacterium]
MNTENVTLPPTEIEVSILTGSPGSSLGQIVATKAALKLLENHNLRANYFPKWHEWSEGAALDRLNIATNQVALIDVERVKSENFTEAGPVLVMTEAVNHDGAICARAGLTLPNEV